MPNRYAAPFGARSYEVGKKNGDIPGGVPPRLRYRGGLAPAMLILLRLCQGLAVGGEWGGAVLMAMECAPPGKHGLYASFAHVSAPVGRMLSTGVSSLASLLPGEQFLAWGWRVPFLLSARVGLYGRAGGGFDQMPYGAEAPLYSSDYLRGHLPSDLNSAACKTSLATLDTETVFSARRERCRSHGSDHRIGERLATGGRFAGAEQMIVEIGFGEYLHQLPVAW